MSVTVRTLKAFSGPDGRFDKDVEVPLPADRANALAEQGFVVRVDKPAPKVTPARAVEQPDKKTND